MTPTTTHSYKQVYSSTMFAALTMLVLLLVGANCTVAEAGSMLTSDSDPRLAVRATYLGVQYGTVLKLVDDCRPDIPDCTWTYRDGMLLSDRNPSLGMTAFGGQSGTVLVLSNCMSDYPQCTWTYHNGMLIRHSDPGFAVTATDVGGQQGTVLTLTNNCTSNNPHCTWTYHKIRLHSDTIPSIAIAPGGVGDGTVLTLDNMNCLPFGCTWTYRQGMLLNDRDPSLAVTDIGVPQHGTGLKLGNHCRPDNPHCTWTYRQGMLLSDSDPSLAISAYGGTPGNWTGGNEPLGTDRISGGPAAVLWRTNLVKVFVRGDDGRLYETIWDGSTSTPKFRLGNEQFIDQPAAVSRGNRIDVFVRGTDGRLYTKYDKGDGDDSWWIAYIPLGNEEFIGSPAAVLRGDRIDVFVQGTDNRLYRKSWDGYKWAPNYEPLGTEQIEGSPVAVSRGERLDVFVQGTDNRLWAKSWDGSTWTPGYSQLGTESIYGVLAAVSWGDRIDVFVRGDGGRLYKKSWNGSSWAPTYEPLGQDIFDGRPAVVSWGSNRIDVFFQDVYDQRLHVKSWNDTKVMLVNNCAPHGIPGCTWAPYPGQLIGINHSETPSPRNEPLTICDPTGPVCGISDRAKVQIMVTGRGTCGSFRIKWGDGEEEEIRGWNFDKSRWSGEHRYTKPSAKAAWPGPKIIHAFAVASCTGEAKLPVNVLLKQETVDSAGNPTGTRVWNLAYKAGALACYEVLSPPPRPMRTGAIVTISEFGPLRVNFGCGPLVPCITNINGLPGPTPSSFPFPDMNRFSLVLRIHEGGPGGVVQVAQGGIGRKFVVNRDGPLEFCMNDDVRWDNHGVWQIAISVDETKAP